ncbi:unnamed protein product [Rotaria socialis]
MGSFALVPDRSFHQSAIFRHCNMYPMMKDPLPLSKLNACDLYDRLHNNQLNHQKTTLCSKRELVIRTDHGSISESDSKDAFRFLQQQIPFNKQFNSIQTNTNVSI